jgi:hypothetical protein
MSNIVVSASATGAGVITLAAPVTATNRTITLPDATGTLLSTATPGVPIGGPAFSAYSGSNQTLSNSTWVKVQFGLEEFDTNSNYDNATNYRFTPTVAGYYQVIGACNFATNSSATRFLQVYKNGSSFKQLQNVVANGLNYMELSGSCLVYLNGSTDYVELYALQNSGGSLDTSGNQSQVYFQAAMVRSAT